MCVPKRCLETESASCVGLLGCSCDLNEWYLSRLDESCRCEKFEQSCDAESEEACWFHMSHLL